MSESVTAVAPFHGAKVALLSAGRLLAYRRDDVAGIPHPGAWDLPGGGREGRESPEDCVLRETEEEFGLRLPASRLIWRRVYDNGPGVLPSAFFAGALTREEVAAIRFGDEGQEWRMMPVAEFLHHPGAIPLFRHRLADALALLPEACGWS